MGLLVYYCPLDKYFIAFLLLVGHVKSLAATTVKSALLGDSSLIYSDWKSWLVKQKLKSLAMVI